MLVDETRVSRLGADDLEALGQHGRDGPICQDEVQVPLLLTLTAEALGIAIAVEGQVVAPAIMPTDGSGVRVEASFPVDTATLPAPPADATAAFLVAMFPDEDPQELVLAWALEEGSERILVMTQ